MKDPKYKLWINIDYDSLHFSYGGDSKPLLFTYEATKDESDKLLHFFRHDNYAFLIVQKPKNPINIQAHDYEGETLRYSYECKLDTVYKENHKYKDMIPITWKKSGSKMLKFMKEVALPWIH